MFDTANTVTGIRLQLQRLHQVLLDLVVHKTAHLCAAEAGSAICSLARQNLNLSPWSLHLSLTYGYLCIERKKVF